MPANESNLKIGIATADITPPVGVTLVGYKPRTSDSLGHTLRAEALVCEGEDGAWALITSDIIGYTGDYVQDVRERASECTGLAADSILLSGTHTHSAPSPLTFSQDEVPEIDADYLEGFKAALAQLVADAYEARRPGAFETAWTSAPTIGSNRRIESEDGQWTNEWQDPEGEHPGFFDPAVLLVGVRRPDGELDGLLVNYGVHPVVLGPSSLAISADYVGYMKDAVEGRDVAGTVLFAQAGGANINPRVCIMVGEEYPREVGQALADVVLDAVGDLAPVPGGPVRSHVEPWTIVRTRDAMKRKSRPGSNTGDEICTEIMVLRAGDLGFVSLPGELFSEFNAMLREASPLAETAVVSLANGYVGYLPTDVAQEQGAYETRMAAAEGLETMIMEHARRAFDAVADRVGE